MPTLLATPLYSIRNTIRAIILVICILIVAVWALVGFSLVTSRQAAMDVTHSDTRNLMIAFREEIGHILRGIQGETNLIAEKMRRERGGMDLYAWGKENLMVSPGIAQVTMTDPNGKRISTTLEPNPGLVDLSDRGHVRAHLDGRFPGMYIGQTVVGRAGPASGVPLFPISLRIEAEDGTFLGVLIVLIAPSALTNLHKAIDLGPHGVMALTGLDDIIRARFAAGTKGIGTSMAGGGRPAVFEENAEGRFVQASDGITRLYIFGRVGSYPLVVTVGLDLDQRLGAWHWYAAVIIGMALSATLLLVGCGAYLIRRNSHDAATTLAALAANVELRESKERAEAAHEAAEAGLRENERITRELHAVQSDLVTTARQAGMAEIANNVLHNVGNVLNSVNVSAGLVNSKMRDSKAQGLAKAVQLMNEHEADLGDFLSRDERGKLLPGYLNKLVAALTNEQQAIVEELGSLTKSIDHITEIVATQQSYAGAASVIEAVHVRDLIEDALRINAGALAQHQVTVVKEFTDQPLLLLDKARVLQILVNLIGNARQAMDGVIDRLHRMTLRMDVADVVDGRRLRISVEDDGEGEGEGVAPENIARLFVHGFTTHNKGHGFGLHSCALAAKEMGGTLTAQSQGVGKGATFTLELPVNLVGDHP